MIVLDFDGVVANIAEKMIKYIENRSGIAFVQNDPPIHDIRTGFSGLSGNKTHQYIKEFIKITSYEDTEYNTEPYEYQLTFYALSKIQYYQGKVDILTARSDEVTEATMVWIRKWFGNLKVKIHHSPSKNKHQYLTECGFDAIVEDRLSTANMCSEHGIKAYLVKRPWNTGRDIHNNVIVVNNLFDAINHYEGSSWKLN